MWSAYHLLGNQEAWNALPPDVQGDRRAQPHQVRAAAAARHALLNDSLSEKLARRGMTINRADTSGFRTKLAASGFYTKWRDKFGAQAWALLEKTSGKLAACKGGRTRRSAARALARAAAACCAPTRRGCSFRSAPRRTARAGRSSRRRSTRSSRRPTTSCGPGTYPGDAALRKSVHGGGGVFAYWNDQPFDVAATRRRRSASLAIPSSCAP